MVSLPMRGVWIEIADGCCSGPSSESLPMRGVWIEIADVEAFHRRFMVTPHAGSVD